jgi:hypothetical protein
MAGEQPKKPTGGAYGQYMAEMRPALQQECEGKPVTEIAKLAGARFKALGDTEKAMYQKKYEQAKTEYDENMKAFLDAGGEKTMKTKNRKAEKPKKDPAAPKRPAGGAYGCFLAKHRREFETQTAGQSITAVTKLASTKWRALTEDEKKPYAEAYAAKKTAYDEAMKSYRPPGAESDDNQAKKRRVSKEENEGAKQTETSKKEAAKEQKNTEKDAKKAAPKGKSKKATPEAPSVELTRTVETKAEKANLKDKLLKLAAHEDVMSSGKSQMDMLKALEDNNGLLRAAKRALLRTRTESERS